MSPWRRPLRWHLQQFAIAFVGINVPLYLFATVAAVAEVYAQFSHTASMACGIIVVVPALGGWYWLCWRKGWMR